ncbi:MAG: hypothetical protein AMJ69_10400 [Gammaproteobacteria bacterium SG8_47]|nr:MAG: hypothetical protein AMJ69_10400 [Gammaproteobacteria bacterium SG8_47]
MVRVSVVAQTALLTTIGGLLVSMLGACQSELALEQQAAKPQRDLAADEAVVAATGLRGELIHLSYIAAGRAPAGFRQLAGADYKPSHNEDPAIPVQCWVETAYGTQNACKYCHTNYLANEGHGNAFPIGEDQLRYSFPNPGLNRVNWPNVLHPQRIAERLTAEGIAVPQPGDLENLDYVRTDNWRAAYTSARAGGDDSWNNMTRSGQALQLMPALNPDNLYPYDPHNPTDDGRHGYIDENGFVRDANDSYTGWRAINFFPYAIFTPLTGSVSGVYIRLPRKFMTKEGKFNARTYIHNLELLEFNIKNRPTGFDHYIGDARDVSIKRGFYPVGTEFAHPLHYVDLAADGQHGTGLDGVVGATRSDYEFPGARSKRVKEIRYLYKWKEVSLDDIGENTELAGQVIGQPGQGWIDNKAGWILAAYIEDRNGALRPQTTEELLQCLGCHSSVGNTIDAVWSFQRKLPGSQGWREMDYGEYDSANPQLTRLADYRNQQIDKGELEYFYHSVVGADLFGVMPTEIDAELRAYAEEHGLKDVLKHKHALELIFDDARLKNTARDERESILRERAAIMRHYAAARAYLYHDRSSGQDFIKGTVFYPSQATMRANIAGYRRIVLDQSFNLGKNTFGTQPDQIPFTFRSDGSVRDADSKRIPAGEIIESRPWGDDGVGNTPTQIASVNAQGEAIDAQGNPVDIDRQPERVVGHISQGGTFDPLYNPIISGVAVKKED